MSCYQLESLDSFAEKIMGKQPTKLIQIHWRVVLVLSYVPCYQQFWILFEILPFKPEKKLILSEVFGADMTEVPLNGLCWGCQKYCEDKQWW